MTIRTELGPFVRQCRIFLHYFGFSLILKGFNNGQKILPQCQRFQQCCGVYCVKSPQTSMVHPDPDQTFYMAWIRIRILLTVVRKVTFLMKSTSGRALLLRIFNSKDILMKYMALSHWKVFEFTMEQLFVMYRLCKEFSLITFLSWHWDKLLWLRRKNKYWLVWRSSASYWYVENTNFYLYHFRETCTQKHFCNTFSIGDV